MKKIIFIAALVAASQVTFASPRKYTQCANAGQIVLPADNNGFFMDSDDCNTAYVLPPTHGELKIQAYKTTIDQATCSATTATLDIINQKVVELKKDREELVNAQKELDLKHSDLPRLRSSCSPQEDNLGQIDVVVVSIQAQLDNAQEEKTQLEQTKADCVQNPNGYACASLETKEMKVEKKIEKAREAMFKLNSQKRVLDAQLKVCVAQRDAKIARIVANDADFRAKTDQIFNEITAAQQIIDQQVARYDGKPGAMMSVTFDAKTQQTVNSFKVANGNTHISFKPMPIKSGVITFERIEDGVAAGIPILTKSEIMGLEVTKGDRGELQTRLAQSGADTEDLAFKDITSGLLVVNQLVACQLLEKVGQKNEKDAAKEVAGLFSPKVTYRYNLQVKRGVKVRYNESHLYQLVKKVSSSSGLFHSSSSSSLTQTSEAQKWIDIEISNEDSDVKFADSEKMMMDIRREFLDAALMKVARSYLTPQQLQQVEPGPNGATTVSSDLHKVPNLYAQYAAIALDIGNAFFGGSTSEASMTQIVKASEGQTLTDIPAIDEYGSQVFDLKAE
jgi:hypothetical protein